MAEPATFLTIGHSTHSLDEFIGLLQQAGVQQLADVRTVPRSRRNPQFNRDSLPQSLAEVQIGYVHLPALGGLRNHSHDVPADTNGNWQNQSFHNYADYALSAEFQQGLHELQQLGQRGRTAIMCAEAVWWRCHRRIIADYLLAAGMQVDHIMPDGRIDDAHLTQGAMVQPDAAHVHYPALPLLHG